MSNIDGGWGIVVAIIIVIRWRYIVKGIKTVSIIIWNINWVVSIVVAASGTCGNLPAIIAASAWTNISAAIVAAFFGENLDNSTYCFWSV